MRNHQENVQSNRNSLGKFLKILLSLVLVVAAMIIADQPASASTAKPSAISSAKVDTSCTINIDKAGNVLTQSCQSLPSGARSSASVVPASSCGTPLIQYWKDANYSGTTTTICGNSGTCDSTGYGIKYVATVFVGFPRQVSSFQMFGSCRVSGWWDGTDVAAYSGGYSGRRTGQYYSTLVDWNDRIGSMKLYSV